MEKDDHDLRACVTFCVGFFREGSCCSSCSGDDHDNDDDDSKSGGGSDEKMSKIRGKRSHKISYC